MGILRFLESLEPPGGKSKALGTFYVILNAWKFIKIDGFGVAMGVYGLIFGQKEGKYIQEAF